MRKRLSLLAVDVAIVVLATFLALCLRANFEPRLEEVWAISPYLAASVFMAVIAFPVFGLNRSMWRLAGLRACANIVAACCVVIGGAVAIGFSVNRLDFVSRSLPVIQLILMILLMLSTRGGARMRYIRRVSESSASSSQPLFEAQEYALVIGANRLSDLFVRSTDELSAGRLRVAGLLVTKDHHVGRTASDIKILGTVADLERVIADLEVHGISISRIVVALRRSELGLEGQSAVLRLERNSDIRVEFLDEMLGFSQQSQSEVSEAEDPKFLEFSFDPVAIRTSLARPYWTWKRAFDIALSLTLIVVLFPLILAVGLAVALVIGNPIVFWQQRPGRGGRTFRLFKFRTMGAAHDAAGRLVPYDERLSDFGMFLRRTRLDELPQLYNILVGQMSFVGPRPLLPVDQYPAALSARLSVKPGLTGWAQVNGGRTVSAADKSALDLWYIKNASFKLDFAIALATIRMVFVGERPQSHVVEMAWADLSKGL